MSAKSERLVLAERLVTLPEKQRDAYLQAKNQSPFPTE